MRNRLRTISESVRQSIIELDALERKAMVGNIVVDLEGDKVISAYLYVEEAAAHYKLYAASKLQVITFDGEDGVNYHNITGQDIFDSKTNEGWPLYAGFQALYKTGGNEEMKETSMVLVDFQELESVVIDMNMSLGEEDPTILFIPALTKLEKAIENSFLTEADVLDVVALRGVAKVLELALNAAGPHNLTNMIAGKEVDKEVSREEHLESYVKYAMESIYEITGE